MRIKSDIELLDIDVRKQIIEEILSRENQTRKDEAYRRHLCNKDQTDRFVTEMLLKQFDSSTVEQMQYSISNISIAKKIINKLAKVYSHGVERGITGSESETEKLQQLADLLKADTKLKTTNKYLKLQRNTLAYVKPCEFVKDGETKFKLKLIPLSPHLYDVVENYNDREEPMAVILSNYEETKVERVAVEAQKEGRVINQPLPTPKGNAVDEVIADPKEDENADHKTFIFWSDNYHFTCNKKGEFLDKDGMLVYSLGDSEIENPIGELPFEDLAIDRDNSYWAQGGKDLIDGCVLVNSMISNLNHIAVTQGYGQFWMSGTDLPRTVLTGPDKAIILEYQEGDPAPQLGYVSASPSLNEIRQGIEMYIALLLTVNNLSTSGVATQLTGSVAASGIALIIDKSESQEDVQDQQQVFVDAEPGIFRKASKWIDVLASDNSLAEEFKGLSLADGFESNYEVVFGKPQTIISEQEQLANIEKRKDLGLDTMVDLMKKDKPGLSDEQALAKLLEVQKEKLERMQEAVENAIDMGGDNPDNEDDEDVDNDKEDESDNKKPFE